MDQRVEFEEYEDPVTHQRYKIKKITQYIKEEVQENEVDPNWESIVPSDEFISVDQLPAVMQRVQASQLQQPPLVVTNNNNNQQTMQMSGYPVQNMGYAMQPQSMNYSEQFYQPSGQYPPSVVQPNSGYQGYNVSPGQYQQYQTSPVRRNEYLAPVNPAPPLATMGQPFATPSMYPQPQQQRGPVMMPSMQQVPQQQPNRAAMPKMRMPGNQIFQQLPQQRQPLPQQVFHAQAPAAQRAQAPQYAAQQYYPSQYYYPPQTRAPLQQQMPASQPYNVEYWPQMHPSQPMMAPMPRPADNQSISTATVRPNMNDHRQPQPSTSYTADNLSADPYTRIPKINLLQPRLTNEGEEPKNRRKRISRKRISSSDDEIWQPSTKRVQRTPSTSSTISSSAEEVLSHVSETASEQSWSSSASIPVRVAPKERRSRFTANKNNWSHMVTPCSVKLCRLTRKHIAVLKASLKESLPRSKSEQCLDTEEPPELSSNNSSPSTKRQSPLQPIPPPTPSKIALNSSILVVNEPLIDAADNFAIPEPKEDNELKNESCETDSYQLAEKASLNMVLSTKPTTATRKAIEDMDQGSVAGKRKRGRKPKSSVAQPTPSGNNGIDSIRSSSHNAQRFQNLNDVLVARKNSQHLRSPLTQKRPSSSSSATSVSSDELTRHQPSPDQSTNPKKKSAAKELSNDDWWPKPRKESIKPCSVSLERIDGKFADASTELEQNDHLTKADADSTTDSPVPPSSSPAASTAHQPPTLTNILAMRQRLHSKRQIALLHDVHSIRLVRRRLTPQPTVAPIKDDVGELETQEQEVQNSEEELSLADSVWPAIEDCVNNVEDNVDSTKLSDTSDDFDGLLALIAKDDDNTLNISIDERQIEQIESELGEDSLLLILNGEKERKEIQTDEEDSTDMDKRVEPNTKSEATGSYKDIDVIKPSQEAGEPSTSKRIAEGDEINESNSKDVLETNSISAEMAEETKEACKNEFEMMEEQNSNTVFPTKENLLLDTRQSDMAEKTSTNDDEQIIVENKEQNEEFSDEIGSGTETSCTRKDVSIPRDDVEKVEMIEDEINDKLNEAIYKDTIETGTRQPAKQNSKIVITTDYNEETEESPNEVGNDADQMQISKDTIEICTGLADMAEETSANEADIQNQNSEKDITTEEKSEKDPIVGSGAKSHSNKTAVTKKSEAGNTETENQVTQGAKATKDKHEILINTSTSVEETAASDSEDAIAERTTEEYASRDAEEQLYGTKETEEKGKHTEGKLDKETTTGSVASGSQLVDENNVEQELMTTELINDLNLLKCEKKNQKETCVIS